jgi:hypothetical protein
MTVLHDDGQTCTGRAGLWESFDPERVEKDTALRKEAKAKVRVFHIGPVY